MSPVPFLRESVKWADARHNLLNRRLNRRRRDYWYNVMIHHAHRVERFARQLQPEDWKYLRELLLKMKKGSA